MSELVRKHLIECGNCDGQVCMGCVLREWDHKCEDKTCPTCEGDGTLVLEYTVRRARPGERDEDELDTPLWYGDNVEDRSPVLLRWTDI